uniref:uncharacterized protein LOC122778679 isoform X2 n=1 Tax=Solea senegalensis TaxID=28829 RepID=UPI001CD8891D|nr:uncharacterized protein LOC122778679 isoform X2 [Solea senegalensis]
MMRWRIMELPYIHHLNTQVDKLFFRFNFKKEFEFFFKLIKQSGNNQEELQGNSIFPDDLDPEERLIEIYNPWIKQQLIYFKIESEATNQRAYAKFFQEATLLKEFPPVKPQFKKPHKHAEEKIIEDIDEYLVSQNLNGKNNLYIVIYTYQSPCLKRADNIDPCIYKILLKTHQWHIKYKCITTVLYTDKWGPIGSKLLQNQRGLRDMCSEKHTDKTFPLDSGTFNKIYKINPNIFFHLVKAVDRNRLKGSIRHIKSKLCELKKGSFNYRTYLRKCDEITSSLPIEIREHIGTLWESVVENCNTKYNLAVLTRDCNYTVVDYFFQNIWSILGTGQMFVNFKHHPINDQTTAQHPRDPPQV